jgi:hypothetical protein
VQFIIIINKSPRELTRKMRLRIHPVTRLAVVEASRFEAHTYNALPRCFVAPTR